MAVLDEAFRAGLDGLDGFAHAWRLTWLGAGEPFGPAELHQRPAA